MFDFAALPPEINSGRMFLGPGAGPMLAAASAWALIGDELRAAAVNHSHIIADLVATWHGPSAGSMTRAAAPLSTWLHTTATAAEQAAAQATAAAGAYELAFAMTVPPPLIAANRILLATLVATNFFGQNTPAIAATEAHYAQMWIQDAVAMYTYAGSSAAASRLTGFTPPAPGSNPAGLTAQAAAVAHAATGGQPTTLPQLMAATPSALQQLAAPLVTTTSPTLVDYLEHVPNLVNTTMSTSNAVTGARGIDITNQRVAFQQARTPRPLVSPGVLPVAPTVTVTFGGAARVDGLSVPKSWTAAPTAIRPVAMALPATGPVDVAPAAPAVPATPPGTMFGAATLGTLQRPGDRRRHPESDPVLVRPAAAR